MYQTLDAYILEAVRTGQTPQYVYEVGSEARRIAIVTGCETHRIIDGRIQHLRKAGKIVHRTKAQAFRDFARIGWSLVK